MILNLNVNKWLRLLGKLESIKRRTNTVDFVFFVGFVDDNIE